MATPGDSTMELAEPTLPKPNISSIKNKQRRQEAYKELVNVKRKVRYLNNPIFDELTVTLRADSPRVDCSEFIILAPSFMTVVTCLKPRFYALGCRSTDLILSATPLDIGNIILFCKQHS